MFFLCYREKENGAQIVVDNQSKNVINITNSKVGKIVNYSERNGETLL